MLTIVRVHRDGFRLIAWLSGAAKPKVFTPPMQPFFYSPLDLPSGLHDATVVSVRKRLLSNPDVYVDISRVDCPNVYVVKRLSRFVEVAFENRVRFIERNAQDFGFIQKDDRATVLAFDVEASSRGQFPDPKHDDLLTIAVFGAGASGKRVEETFSGDQQSIIEGCCDIVAKSNPDIVATYSGTAFDYEFPLTRAHLLNTRFALGKVRDEPYTKTTEYSRGKFVGVDKRTFLSGRICFDVYHEVYVDTALSGIRRGLKDVAKFYFGREGIIELDRQRLKSASKSDLADYCLSDARQTFKLAEMYLAMLKPIAVELQVPLDMIVNRKPSHIGNLIYGREFNTLDLVSDGTNFDRFRGVLW